MPIQTRHRLTRGSLDVPVSPIRIREHKLGYKPVLGCVCGAVLDTNTTAYRECRAWTLQHEQCEVTT